MTELERFVSWVEEQGPRVNAADELGIPVSSLFSYMSGKRRITDEIRAAWKTAGGDPDTPEIVKPFLETV